MQCWLESHQDHPLRARHAVGPGKRDDEGKQHALDVKVGDRVLFGKYSGQTVKVDGEELLVMREEDIMGVVEGAASVKAVA